MNDDPKSTAKRFVDTAQPRPNTPPRPSKAAAEELTLIADAGELLTLIEAAERSLEAIDGRFGLPDFPEELITLQCDYGATSTGELRVRLNPSEGLRSFVAALRAGDWDTTGIEHDANSARGGWSRLDPSRA